MRIYSYQIHINLYWMKFTLKTDHMPSAAMLSASMSSTIKYLHASNKHWVICLMPYRFIITYQSRSQNSADYLSRLNSLTTNTKHNKTQQNTTNQNMTEKHSLYYYYYYYYHYHNTIRKKK